MCSRRLAAFAASVLLVVLLAGPSSATAQQGGASIGVDKQQYRVGEPIRVCYAVPGPGPVTITNILANGQSRVILQGRDDGRGDCLAGVVTPPAGRECLRLDYDAGTRGSGTRQTCYQVLAPTPSPAPRPTPPAPTPSPSPPPTPTPMPPTPTPPPPSQPATDTVARPSSPPAAVQPDASPPPTPRQAASAAGALAQRILSPVDEADATAAVIEAFARAGVATMAADTGGSEGTLPATPVALAVAPAVPLVLRSVQAQSMARDARERAAGGWRLTLAELGGMLHALGWAVPSETDPGTALASLLAGWVRAARQDPASPHGFTPLFLEAMAQAATPKADLASGRADPQTTRLSLMEVQLILAAHLRGSESYGVSGQQPPAMRAEEGDPGAPAGRFPELLARRAAATQASCGDLEDELGWFKPAHLVALDQVTSVPIEELYDRLGLGKPGRFLASNALNVVSLLITMDAVSFRLRGEPGAAHYSNEAGHNEVSFTASAATIDLVEGQRRLMDCLRTLGFPSVEDVVGGLKDAMVVWKPDGMEGHATWAAAKNPLDFHAPPRTRLGEDRQAAFVFDMKEEQAGAHEDGVLMEETAWFEAALDISQPPGLDLLIAAAIGDVPGPLLEIVTGLYRKWAGPKRLVGVKVSWHEKCGSAAGGSQPALLARSHRTERSGGVQEHLTGAPEDAQPVCRGGAWTGTLSIGWTTQSTRTTRDGTIVRATVRRSAQLALVFAPDDDDEALLAEWRAGGVGGMAVVDDAVEYMGASGSGRSTTRGGPFNADTGVRLMIDRQKGTYKFRGSIGASVDHSSDPRRVEGLRLFDFWIGELPLPQRGATVLEGTLRLPIHTITPQGRVTSGVDDAYGEVLSATGTFANGEVEITWRFVPP